MLLLTLLQDFLHYTHAKFKQGFFSPRPLGPLFSLGEIWRVYSLFCIFLNLEIKLHFVSFNVLQKLSPFVCLWVSINSIKKSLLKEVFPGKKNFWHEHYIFINSVLHMYNIYFPNQKVYSYWLLSYFIFAILFTKQKHLCPLNSLSEEIYPKKISTIASDFRFVLSYFKQVISSYLNVV